MVRTHHHELLASFLDEATCARLLRDLPAFGKPPGRSPVQAAR